MLGHFHTDFYIGNKPILRKVICSEGKKYRSRVAKGICARQTNSIPPGKVVSHDLYGIYSTLRQILGSKGDLSRFYATYAKQFNRRVIRSGLLEADAIFGFSASSLELPVVNPIGE